ncbi:MAG TPA: methylmalonyl-CoA epimerase [Chitinophagaceae bacterium]|nr:methylmalonyl-CoA epimerase [Chitinophagaceae bacterium]
MKHIEHIGLAVHSLSEAIPRFEALLNTVCYKTEEVESEQVRTAFFKLGESKIELLEPTQSQSVIHRFLEKKGEGFHHMAIEVEDIYQEMARLKEEGVRLLNEEPKQGADNKLICFLHPKDTGGILLELCQHFVRPE